MPLIADIQGLDLGTVVDFYVLDLTIIGGVDIFYFHPGVTSLENNVVWQANTYTAWDVKAEGYELSGKGVLPRPTIRVANIGGQIGLLCRQYDDLLGAKLTRKRTLLKYLDAVNFTGGVNPTADPNQHFNDEIYFINRKADQNPIYVMFELAANWDVQGVMLPRRQIITNTCPWLYRGPECGYTGNLFFDVYDDSVATLAEDVCAKRLNSCKIRFGQFSELPFGGFPVAVIAG